eukprot:jgi/Undpi1/5651/HiC_scaffold_2.g00925.m1
MQLWPLASETDGQVDSMGDGMGGFQQFFFKGFAKDNFSEFFIQVAGYMFDEDTPHTPTTGRMGPALNKNTQMLVRYPRSRPWCCFIATAAAYLPGLYLAFVPHPPCDGSRLRLQPDTNPALYSSTSTRPARRIGRSSRKRASTVLDVVVSSALTEEWKSAVLPFAPSEWYRCSSPAESLRRGDWFKLICGASFEDLPAVRNLALVYTLAGADCIDVAAEEAVIEAARDGVLAAQGVGEAIGAPVRAPWLMMSVNDDEEDPHFRKAAFDASLCPSDCPRPCEMVCPADAVVFPDSPAPPAQRATMVAAFLGTSAGGGVLGPRCYGCGRCITVCPPGIIRSEKYMRSPEVIRELLEKVDAVEIHTKGDLAHFRDLWENSVADAAAGSLKLVAVSFPDLGDDTGLTVAAMNAVMNIPIGGTVEAEVGAVGDGRSELQGAAGDDTIEATPARALNVWQTDGRPMSGDTGRGATTACVRLAQKKGATTAAATPLSPPPLPAPRENQQQQHQQKPQGQQQQQDPWNGGRDGVGGVAYGGYARKVVGRALDRLPGDGAGRVEDHPEVLSAALQEALLLVGGLKRRC